MSETRNTKFVLKITIFLLLVGFVIFCANIVMFFIYTNIVRSTARTAEKNSKKHSYLSSDNTVIAGHEFVVVKTPIGSLKGTKVKELGGSVYKFLGVPYATSPVGEFRFRRPVPIKQWKGVLNATTFANECIQDYDKALGSVTEDCLYLNIWTSSLNQSETKLKPVMIWVHEGEFIDGSASRDILDGSALALLGDVVVVTFNYRLGVFGFFDMSLVDSPGNQGLYDQAMAFQWVKENIKYFGGNPYLITLFGQSSGAIAIGLHLVSPISKRLFKRAILQSGSPLVFHSYFANSRKVALRLSEILYCYDSRHKVMVPESVLQCMKNKTVDELLVAQKQLLSEREYAFSPSAREGFLPTIPVNVIINYERNRGFESLHDLMVGVTNDEGSIFVNFIMPELLAKERLTSTEIRNLLINNSKKLLISESKARLLANTFLKEAPAEESSEFWFKILSNIVGDLFITCPSMSFAEEMTKLNKTVYFYVFNHKSPLASPHPWIGVPHASEIPYVFGLPLRFPAQFSGKDIEVSKTVIKAWSAFATSGSMPGDLDSNWTAFTSKTRDYFEIKASKSRMKQKFHENNCGIFQTRYEEFKEETKPRTVNVKVGWTIREN